MGTSSSSSSSSSLDYGVKFGLFTDSHHANGEPPVANRYYDDSAQKLTDAINNHFNVENLDFVVELGDYIEDVNLATDQINLAAFDAIYSTCTSPIKYVFGNHELVNLTKSQFKIVTGMPSNYYSFNIGTHPLECHFVILDCMHRSDGSDAEAGNFSVNDLWISDTEKTWLINDLQANSDKPTYVFCHFLFSASVPSNRRVQNYLEMQGIFTSFNQVQAVFSGHWHQDFYEQVGGVHYIAMDALVDYPYPDNTYSIIEVDPDLNITITGIGGHQTSYLLDGRSIGSSSSSSHSSEYSSSSSSSSVINSDSHTLPFSLKIYRERTPIINDIEFSSVIRRKFDVGVYGDNSNTLKDAVGDVGKYKYSNSIPNKLTDLPSGFKELYKESS